MKDMMKSNTEGNETTDELANMEGDMDRARRAELLPRELKVVERQQVKQCIPYSAHFHAGGGELNGVQKLEDRKQEKRKFQGLSATQRAITKQTSIMAG